MSDLYIIAGPNGAGKTTLSFSILPEIYNCEEFINADEIARGLSPFNPAKASLRAGRLMLNRINELMTIKKSFAFETTLATRSYRGLINRAKQHGYRVQLLFLYLNSEELAIKRVKTRVAEGGHNIPENVIRRRYHAGLENFLNEYINLVDEWLFVNNSQKDIEFIAKGIGSKITVENDELWTLIRKVHG